MTAEASRSLFEESSIQKSTDLDEKEDCNDGDEDEDDDVYQVFEEFDFSQLPETESIASDDSFYPPDQSSPTPQERLTFFMACTTNNVIIVKIMIRQGLTQEEVRHVDKNNRVRVYHATQ